MLAGGHPQLLAETITMPLLPSASLVVVYWGTRATAVTWIGLVKPK